MISYDDWKLASPPEADEQRIDFICTALNENDIQCEFDGHVIAEIYGDKMTWQCPDCDACYEDSARDWFFDD